MCAPTPDALARQPWTHLIVAVCQSGSHLKIRDRASQLFDSQANSRLARYPPDPLLEHDPYHNGLDYQQHHTLLKNPWRLPQLQSGRCAPVQCLQVLSSLAVHFLFHQRALRVSPATTLLYLFLIPWPPLFPVYLITLKSYRTRRI
jgi:hypothetical protein